MTPIENKQESAGIETLTDGILQYFREFLETDFKKIGAPRRKTHATTKSGFTSSIDLRKYQNLFKDIWALAYKKSPEMKLRITRSKYRTEVSPVLKNMVEQFASKIDESAFQETRQAVLEYASSQIKQKDKDPEVLLENIRDQLYFQAHSHIVKPLLTLLESAFRQSAYAPEESIFEIENDLTESMCASAATHLMEASNELMITGDETRLANILDEFFTSASVCPSILEFFETYSTSDVMQDIRDLLNYMRSDDQLVAYLYYGSIRYETHEYPLFYLPITISTETETSAINIDVDPRIYIHKQAMEYIVNSLGNEAEQKAIKTFIPQRIAHLNLDQSAMEVIKHNMMLLGQHLDLATMIELGKPTPDAAKNPDVRISNACHFAIFDRSDESLVNDYEALSIQINEDHQQAHDMFKAMVHSIIYGDPISASAEIRSLWDEKNIEDRLISNCPIPLNEEQMRIDAARRHANCNHVVIEGPPGTGKSHTIAAITFQAIMDGQSVLIISDKNEALDVVEDKLGEALGKVRLGEDFPNPILRLGKNGTYRGLISASSRQKIQTHHKAQHANMPLLERELNDRTASLNEQILSTRKALTGIDPQKVHQFLSLENDIKTRLKEDAEEWLNAILINDRSYQEALSKTVAVMAADAFLKSSEASNLFDINGLASYAQKITHVHGFKEEAKNFGGLDHQRHFPKMRIGHKEAIKEFAQQSLSLKRPIIGYLFQGKKLRELEQRIQAAIGLSGIENIGKKTKTLEAALQTLEALESYCSKHQEAKGLEDQILQILNENPDHVLDQTAAFELKISAETIRETLNNNQLGYLCGLQCSSDNSFHTLMKYLALGAELDQEMCAIPSMDYAEEKRHIEDVNTAFLAHELDTRFLNFIENHRATAQALGGVIKQRAQFPVDQFKTLSSAFPCVIAGIRQLGEYMPMKTGLFDILIIDEGSQVSVAQAMPAMLRAKKIFVFGDSMQFANVKSTNASNVTNSQYISEIKDIFRKDVSTASDKLERLARFDVKRSVLEYMSLVANHTEMLRKHFRGYPELISYSSKNFYNDSLQAIKIRAKPIEEVIEFEVVPHDSKEDLKRNTNDLEAKAILERLLRLLEQPNPPSVGIITPHSEQAAHIASTVTRHSMGDEFERRLRLKVMTFDSCQGEERDIIIYSMVATRDRDVLNYIFPVEFKTDDEDGNSLKAQRLNVGLSRAKEKMVFVLSKEPEEFKGTIGRALLHYKQILNQRHIAQAHQTDKSSPMEAKLLHWIKNTEFFKANEHRIELIAQFPVGDYLRQLDQTYQHPAYKVDFLLRIKGKRNVNLIIEYDGFEFHFDTSKGKVGAHNFERYYTDSDVERQFVLESYGYKFLRINRFNVGRDPVATLQKMLSESIPKEALDISCDKESPSAIQNIKQQAQALHDKEAKTCARCHAVKEIEDFFDPNLGGGAGGFGRICMPCKY